MKTFIKQNKWFIIIAGLIIILLPIGLNYILLIPLNASIVGDSTHWLLFWGGYLGAILSSTVAFIILYVQYRNNSIENRQNRQLQLSVLLYQQETEWLNKFREAMIKNLNIFRNDHLINISNFVINTEKGNITLFRIMDKTNELIDQLTITDTSVAMMVPVDCKREQVCAYNKERKIAYTKCISVLHDIQIISVILCLNTSKSNLLKAIPNYEEMSSCELNDFITRSGDLLSDNILDFMDRRIDSCSCIYDELRSSILDCIAAEQVRINSIIKESI